MSVCGESIGRVEEPPNTNTQTHGAAGAHGEEEEKEQSPCIIVSASSNNNEIKPGVLVCSLCSELSTLNPPCWPGALFFH